MNLIDYFEQHRPKTYITEWHSRQVCRALQQAYESRQNLIIESMPRSGKSEQVNVFAPAWWLESHPDATFGLVCSEDGLAGKFVSGTRRLLADKYEMEIDRTNEFKIRGTRSLDLSYTGRGIHSNLSGRGFDAVVFDDVLKSGSDAQSENIRERLWTDVCSAAINRLSPSGIEDTLYYRCECKGFFPRMKHAVISTFTSRRGDDGHRVFSVPALVAPYAGTMTAVYGWYPDRYGAKDGFRMGNYSVLGYVGGNIALEFLYGGPHSLLSRMHLSNRHGAPDSRSQP
ncbi:MAG: hypothetical protein LAN64_18865 [Acidobacteriia bacterium]|nr:hypothetical protein [Terriglobia bacterium]